METPTLWAFEKDIQSRSWLDWLQAHTSFLKPLHRYEGILIIHPDRLSLMGNDKRTKQEIEFNIYKYQITQLYLGFDETFNAMETRGLGLTWLPLRITFTVDGEEKKLYLITDYTLFRTTNQEWFEFLKQWVNK